MIYFYRTNIRLPAPKKEFTVNNPVSLWLVVVVGYLLIGLVGQIMHAILLYRNTGSIYGIDRRKKSGLSFIKIFVGGTLLSPIVMLVGFCSYCANEKFRRRINQHFTTKKN